MRVPTSAIHCSLRCFSAANWRPVPRRAGWRTTRNSSDRLSRNRNLRILCNQNQDELMAEVKTKLGPDYYKANDLELRDLGEKVEKRLSELPDRGLFVPNPYEDVASDIFEQEAYINHGALEYKKKIITTALQPSLQIFMLRELLQPFAPDAMPMRVLDVGSGSGYSTACLAHLVESGFVWGFENSRLAHVRAHSRLKKWDPEAFRKNRVALTGADVLGDLPKAYPNLLRYGNFDAIHVGAAASFPEEVMKLLDLLKPGGVMIVPQYESEFQSGSQVLVRYTKSKNGIAKQEVLMSVVKFELLSREDIEDMPEHRKVTRA